MIFLAADAAQSGHAGLNAPTPGTTRPVPPRLRRPGSAGHPDRHRPAQCPLGRAEIARPVAGDDDLLAIVSSSLADGMLVTRGSLDRLAYRPRHGLVYWASSVMWWDRGRRWWRT